MVSLLGARSSRIMDKVKILYITSDLKARGGIQKYNKFFLRALNDIGASVSVVELKNNNIFTRAVFIVRVLADLLLFRPTLVIAGHINYAPICFFFSKLMGYRYIVLTYGIEVWDMGSASKKSALKAAKSIVAISNYTKNRLIEQIPEIRNKIVIISNPVDGKEFFIKSKSEALTNHFGLEGCKVILTVARLSSEEKYKGYDKVIEALPSVMKKVPRVKYLLVGDGDDRKRIEELTSQLGVKEDVIMTGRVRDNELINYYNLCDVFIMPSKGEGFGFVFIEALACGKPVVAGNADGSREAILNGQLGILVDPLNINEISNEIVKLLNREARPDLLNADYLRENVIKVYGIDQYRKQVKNLIYGLSR